MYKLYYPGIDQVITETDNLDEMKKYLDKAFERDVGPVTIGLGYFGNSAYYTWKIVYDWIVMDMWERAQNYAGENYYEYFVFMGKHRDSDPLDVSNFRVGLERLGGESETVIVVRSSHWLVGWIEMILIHQSDEDMVYRANDIRVEMKHYPVLDDEDYDKAKIEMGYEEEDC
jgi:hypothetical protein